MLQMNAKKDDDIGGAGLARVGRQVLFDSPPARAGPREAAPARRTDGRAKKHQKNGRCAVPLDPRSVGQKLLSFFIKVIDSLL